MAEQISLLMTETSPELCRLCKEFLPSQGISVSVCGRDGIIALDEIIRLEPDAVLLDIFMPGMDAFMVKRKYEKQFPDAATVFYATGTFQNDELEKEIIENGFAFYYLKPFDVAAFAKRILSSMGALPAPLPEYASAESMVTDILRTIGMPAHIKGYRFLRDAILMVIDNPALINGVTKNLYPEIAKENDTTASRVERAIRHAIEVAWDRGDIETLNHYFGSTVHSLRGKPTNSEFIAMLADHISLTLKKKA